MLINEKELDLPIVEIISEVKEKLSAFNTLIVNAPPGAGKSTLLPITLLNEPWLQGKKILMLEPRRLATQTIAARLSSLLNEPVGETVGYRIRFDKKISKKTRLEVVTEGILTRFILDDNTLEDVGLVIFDEFHERSIHADTALALCRECQQIIRPDLRIMIMSATLNMPELESLLKAPVALSKGRQYPVDIKYVGEVDHSMLAEMTAQTVSKAVSENEGDVLVFLPGEGEIKKTEEILRRSLRDFSIHPLYGQLPSDKQFAALFPNKYGKRKIVLATSIAETSLTIEGIKIVVDSGFGKTSRFDPRSGLSRLETIQISKDSADQRAGRAGRLSAGVCYRMWSLATHQRLQDHRIPEILEADLTPLVLDLAKWGIQEVNQLLWLNPPPKISVVKANELLQELGAIKKGKITEHGKVIQALPCHPRIAHMLLKAKEDDSLEQATDLAAILEERDPLPRDSGIDINLRIEALRRFRNHKGEGKFFTKIECIAESYRKMFSLEPDNGPVNPYETGILLAYTYPERIAYARPGNNAQFQLSNGKIAAAGHKDDLATEPWLAIAHMDDREGLGKIFLASPLNPTDLKPLLKEVITTTWITKKGGVIATRDVRLGSIVLQSKPLLNPNQAEINQAIHEAIKKEGKVILPFDDEKVIQWQNRISSLRIWQPEENWPDVSTENLLLSNEEWLAPYLIDIKTPVDLKKLDLAAILQHHLSYEKQGLLDELAPDKIEVPSGSMIFLKYQANGTAPLLEVRLQEVFGLPETPKVNKGKIAVLMHLLSPGYKLVQITSDLNSFWNNTYYEVKKDLQRRYPRHAWPDDPWTEKAIAGAKRRIRKD